MKKITLILAAIAIVFASCTKSIPVPNATAATITATINKVTTADPAQILINQDCPTCPPNNTFTGTIDWGDGNITSFTKRWTESIFEAHLYAVAATYTVNVNLNSPTAVTSFTIDLNPDQVTSLTGLNGITPTYLVLQDDKLPSIDISGNPGLQSVFLAGNNFTSMNIAANPLLKTVQFQRNNLPIASVNSVLVSLDNAGITNGSVNLSSQIPSAPPSGAGLTAKTNLIGKGWTVITD